MQTTSKAFAMTTVADRPAVADPPVVVVHRPAGVDHPATGDRPTVVDRLTASDGPTVPDRPTPADPSAPEKGDRPAAGRPVIALADPLRVHRGTAGPEELAALMAVLHLRAAAWDAALRSPATGGRRSAAWDRLERHVHYSDPRAWGGRGSAR